MENRIEVFDLKTVYGIRIFFLTQARCLARTRLGAVVAALAGALRSVICDRRLADTELGRTAPIPVTCDGALSAAAAMTGRRPSRCGGSKSRRMRAGALTDKAAPRRS